MIFESSKHVIKFESLILGKLFIEFQKIKPIFDW